MTTKSDGVLCGAQRPNQPQGVTCGEPAGFGTSHVGIGRCKFHGGSSPTHVKSAQLELARRECDRLGIPIEIDPTEALLREVWETVGNVEFYRTLVQQLPAHPDDDEITGYTDDMKPIYKRGEPGVYGRTYHMSGLPTGEAKPHVLVQLYNDDRIHLVDVTGACIRLGIEKRRIDLEERRAAEVFRAVSQALSLMGLEQRFNEFREHFANALSVGRPIPERAGISS